MCGRRSEAAYVADMVGACERMLVVLDREERVGK